MKICFGFDWVLFCISADCWYNSTSLKTTYSISALKLTLLGSNFSKLNTFMIFQTLSQYIFINYLVQFPVYTFHVFVLIFYYLGHKKQGRENLLWRICFRCLICLVLNRASQFPHFKVDIVIIFLINLIIKNLCLP